jgi:hypothetical protein
VKDQIYSSVAEEKIHLKTLIKPKEYSNT